MTQTCNLGDRHACCAQVGALLRPELFRALADPTRLAVLLRLVELGRPATVSEIACCCPIDLSVVSRHLAALKAAGITTSKKEGKEVRYRVLYASLAATLRELAATILACCPSQEDPEPNPGETP
ncbi:MAG TPA: metalloregulator ArsR/SmtB family transcription factor [Thermoanaerobaculia bacterium]|nr:metalloregulator ArsR/SmtB family transcription factor [Thermoanaerobaculia bacterium]